MKIIAFNGSPKGEKGNTHVMVDLFLQGAMEAGADVEYILLAKKDIKPCKGCMSCWLKTPGKCIIDDDVEILLDKYINADIVVFASPVYVGGVTGIMKNFIDRSIPLADPHFGKNDRGETTHYSRFEKEPDIVLISNCGFPEQYHFNYFRSTFEYIVRHSGSNIIAEIYRGQGEMLGIDNPFVAVLLASYKERLKKAGREVVETRCLSEKLKQDLEKPLVPYDQYIEMANKYFDEVLTQVEMHQK
jgi:FMN-dependent NADH-azoreductase